MDRILIGKGDRPVHLLTRYANRHGLIAGATGTGKTISLMVLAEGFSRGVPVIIADVKGDVAGLGVPGTPSDKIRQRVERIGVEGYTHESNPVVFWDLYAKAGHPVRTTVSLTLERDGGDAFLGEPALDLAELLRTDLSGRGIVNIFAADQLVLKPRLYSSFLLWLLSELFENLPEVGDLDKPKLVFFFDEAHLLFDDAPPALRQRVEQVVRIIRSKGVGVFFCSQFPDDVPDEMLGQLGNRIQHALRAFTPRDQKAVRTAAETFVANPSLDVAEVISQMGVGEALVSTLQENGVPMPVERALIAPPRCRMGAITPEERAAIRTRSPIGARYDSPVNRELAHEMLAKRAAAAGTPQDPADSPTRSPAERTSPAPAQSGGGLGDLVWGTKRRQGMVETLAKQAARTVGSQIGRQIFRGMLGGILGGSRRR